MPGRLTICPTPIGNLEDTRRAGRLFELLELPKPRLISYHDHNEDERTLDIALRIERGDRIALISDAGMPGVSDPGYRLIRACIERGIDIEVLPGPSVVPVALVASGLPPDRWRFEGYLPRRPGELERILGSPETVIAFESPRRLPSSLAALAAMAPDRPAAVCRELTKMHEEVARGTLSDLARQFREDVRGEVVVVIGASELGGASPDIALAVDAVRRLVQAGARPRVAATVVATLTGTRANELYEALTGRPPRE